MVGFHLQLFFGCKCDISSKIQFHFILMKRQLYLRDHVAVVNDKTAQDLRFWKVLLHVRLFLTNDPNGKTWSGKGMTLRELDGQT